LDAQLLSRAIGATSNDQRDKGDESLARHARDALATPHRNSSRGAAHDGIDDTSTLESAVRRRGRRQRTLSVGSLNPTDTPLLPTHTYRLQFLVHDGDQNKTGGDVGQACVVLNGM
jgi:hypothetical protein